MHRDAARISSCISRTLLQLSTHSRGILSNTRTMAHREPAAYRNEADSLEQIERRLSSYRAERTAPVSDRHAAVFVALFEDEDDVVRVWLTERSRKLSTHPGEICLPGGKKEAGETDIEAALREANEELGVSPRSVRVLASLPSFLSKHKLSVTPIIGTVTPSFRPQPNEEVEAAFSVPLAAFLQQRLHKSRDVTWGELPYRLHYFHWQSWTVWGLTAAILIQAAQHALGRAPEFAEHNPSGVDYTQLYWDGERVRLQPGADLAAHSPGARMPSTLPSPAEHLPADPSASGPSCPAAAPQSHAERAEAGSTADSAHPPTARQTRAWHVQSAALTGEAEREEDEQA